jgi:hypothetical protein
LKNFNIPLFFILTLLFSCTKKNSNPKSDSILFKSLDSTIHINSVRSWGVEDHTICSVSIPIPSDSTSKIEIDINYDKINDFSIAVSHKLFIPTTYCGHCSIYDYGINIYGINSSDSIVSINQSSNATYFKNNDKINSKNTWAKSSILTMEGGCNRPIYKIDNEYIGIKHNNQVGWIKIKAAPNNGIIIENFAINLTDNNGIVAGQIK